MQLKRTDIKSHESLGKEMNVKRKAVITLNLSVSLNYLMVLCSFCGYKQTKPDMVWLWNNFLTFITFFSWKSKIFS